MRKGNVATLDNKEILRSQGRDNTDGSFLWYNEHPVAW
jgi:hypothetical protein